MNTTKKAKQPISSSCQPIATSTFHSFSLLFSPALIFMGLLLFLLYPSKSSAKTTSPANPWIGIMMKAHNRSGVEVLSVFPNSPAKKAKVKKGDRILSMAGKLLSSPSHLARIVALHKVGSVLQMTLISKGKKRTVKMKLTPRPTFEAMIKSLLKGKKAPDFSLRLPGSTPNFQLSRLKGSVVILQFWSLSCGACLASMPTLSQWHTVYGSKGLVIVGVAKEHISILHQAAKKLKIPFVVGQISDTSASKYHIARLPTFVLVNKKGTIRDLATGFGSSLKRLKKNALKLLKKSP